MQAIEFFSKLEDGTIKVPKEYLASLQKNLRVIILIDEKVTKKQENALKKHATSSKKEASTKKTKKKKFTPPFTVKTKGFAFDRNEANER